MSAAFHGANNLPLTQVLVKLFLDFVFNGLRSFFRRPHSASCFLPCFRARASPPRRPSSAAAWFFSAAGFIVILFRFLYLLLSVIIYP